jgi:hypothetical protein
MITTTALVFDSPRTLINSRALFFSFCNIERILPDEAAKAASHKAKVHRADVCPVGPSET